MNLDFASLIVAERNIIASPKCDRLKLSSLGDIYYDCSLGILVRSEELLNLATCKINPRKDAVIDESFEEFLQGWLRQSVRVGFLDGYMQQPKHREYSRASNVEVVEISPEKAAAAFAVEDNIAEVLEIAHSENISEWRECLFEVMSLWDAPDYTFTQLVKLTSLSHGQVFLALFLDEQFRLSQQGTFYGDILVY